METNEIISEQMPRTAELPEGWGKRLLPHAVIIITLITACLSFLGRSYHEAYLHFWGLPVDLFSISKENSIITGVFTYILFSLKTLKLALIFVISIMIAVYAVIFSCFKPINNLLTKATTHLTGVIADKTKKHLVVTPTHDRLMSLLIGVLGLFILTFLLLSLLSFLYLWVSNTATSAARKEYEELVAGKPSTSPFAAEATIYIKNDSKGDELFSGHLIQTSATHCALYVPAKGVMIFPMSNVSRIIIHEAQKAVEPGAK